MNHPTLQLALLARLLADETVNANFVMFNLRLLEFFDAELGYAPVKIADLERKLGLCTKTIHKYKTQAISDGLWIQDQKGARGRSSHLRPLFVADGGAR